MDPKLGWYQPEQQGPSKDLWSRIWEHQQPSITATVQTIPAYNPYTTNPSPTLNGDSGRSDDYQNNIPGGGISQKQFGMPVNGGIHMNNHWNRVNDASLRKENRARTFGLGLNENVKLSHANGCPWLIPGKQYTRGIIGYVLFLSTYI